MCQNYVMYRIYVRFYGELNDFLPYKWRVQPLLLDIETGNTVQDVIQSTGIPYNVVDLILVNGNPAEFGFKLKPQDRLSIFPEFQCIDISPLNLINRHNLH